VAKFGSHVGYFLAVCWHKKIANVEISANPVTLFANKGGLRAPFESSLGLREEAIESCFDPEEGFTFVKQHIHFSIKNSSAVF
jgi:hypothetical protein